MLRHHDLVHSRTNRTKVCQSKYFMHSFNPLYTVAVSIREPRNAARVSDFKFYKPETTSKHSKTFIYIFLTKMEGCKNAYRMKLKIIRQKIRPRERVYPYDIIVHNGGLEQY